MSNKKLKYNSTFQAEWLNNPEFYWLQRDPTDGTKAFWKLCSKPSSVAAHGKKAIDIHAKGEKHKSKMRSVKSANSPQFSSFLVLKPPTKLK